MMPERLPAWSCAVCHAGIDDACERLTASCTIDAELVIHRLEQAGATLLAMRDRSPYPAPYRCALPEVVRTAIEAYGWEDAPIRPATPSAASVSQMERVYQWLQIVPQHRFVVRRIVAARSLVHPVSGRHLFGWRTVGRMIRADHHAAQRWHNQGIEIICQGLTKTPK